MTSQIIKDAISTYKAVDLYVARACFKKINAKERDKYITATRVLNSVRSD